MMRKVMICIALLWAMASMLSVDICADKVYEYELVDGGASKAEDKMKEFYDLLPDDIKDELPAKREDIGEYDTEFFEKKVKDALKEAVGPALETLALLMGSLIFSALFSMLADTVTGDSLKSTFSFCSSLCIVLCIWDSLENVLNTAGALLNTLTSTMLMMIPTMEAVYISSGNLTGAAVNSTGINIMIGFAEALFSKVIMPCASGVFVMAIVGVLTGDRGVSYITKTIRGAVTGGIMAAMTLMTFVLALQSAGGAAQDGFIRRTVKFAIGNYLPIVGSAVADSFSVLSGSLNVIKHTCGIGGIAVIVVAFISPFSLILLTRLSVGFSGAMASVFGCGRESLLFEECKGICTLLLAVCAGGGVMYIIALGIFCKTPVTFG